MTREITTVGVVGLGTMGAGIVEVLEQHGDVRGALDAQRVVAAPAIVGPTGGEPRVGREPRFG